MGPSNRDELANIRTNAQCSRYLYSVLGRFGGSGLYLNRVAAERNYGAYLYLYLWFAVYLR
jgi:hypothetical protein